MKKIKDIYKMELWQVENVNCFVNVMRVPGGWVCMFYETGSDGNEYLKTTTFIPFNGEFQVKESA